MLPPPFTKHLHRRRLYPSLMEGMCARVFLLLLTNGLPALTRADEVAIALVALFLLCCPFVVWMIVDCARYESLDNANVKHVWLLIILFVPSGSLIYFFVRKRRRHRLPS